jgi:hypothetical protein
MGLDQLQEIVRGVRLVNALTVPAVRRRRQRSRWLQVPAEVILVAICLAALLFPVMVRSVEDSACVTSWVPIQALSAMHVVDQPCMAIIP